MKRKKLGRMEADQKTDEAVRLYVHGFHLAGVQLADPQLKIMEQTVRDLSKEYVESVYELYDC